MLTRMLWHTGMAGFADGYFADSHVLDCFERWGFSAGDPAGLADGYVRMLMAHRTSPNGVFGVKVHGADLTGLGADLDELLLSPRYVWLRRRDRLRQAISYALAKQTGVWILDGTYLPVGEAASEPRYSYAELRNCLRHIDNDVRIWAEYFDRRGFAPHVVFYEDLIADHEKTVIECLRHLGVEIPSHVPGPGIERQAGEVTERWLERFERDDARRRAATGSWY
jgi:LPS sulfotransferase NodH